MTPPPAPIRVLVPHRAVILCAFPAPACRLTPMHLTPCLLCSSPCDPPPLQVVVTSDKPIRLNPQTRTQLYDVLGEKRTQVLIDNIGFDPRPPRDGDVKEKDVKVFHQAWGKNAEWYMPMRMRAERWRRDPETPLPSGPSTSSTARGQSDGSTRLSKTLSM